MNTTDTTGTAWQKPPEIQHYYYHLAPNGSKVVVRHEVRRTRSPDKLEVSVHHRGYFVVLADGAMEGPYASAVVAVMAAEFHDAGFSPTAPNVGVSGMLIESWTGTPDGPNRVLHWHNGLNLRASPSEPPIRALMPPSFHVVGANGESHVTYDAPKAAWDCVKFADPDKAHLSPWTEIPGLL